MHHNVLKFIKMKKLLLASAVALFGLSNAQIAKGTTYVSGVVGFTQDSDNNTDKKESTFAIVPTVGYFVNTNLAIGLGVGYVNNKVEETKVTNVTPYLTLTEKGKDINNAVVVEPFIRKYWTLGEKLYFFGQLSVPMSFGSGKVEGTATLVDTTPGQPVTTENTSISQDKNKINSFGVSVKPGLDYFLNKNWSIEATIGNFGYQSTKVDVDGAKSTDNFNFGVNLKEINFGVKYVFGK